MLSRKTLTMLLNGRGYKRNEDKLLHVNDVSKKRKSRSKYSERLKQACLYGSAARCPPTPYKCRRCHGPGPFKAVVAYKAGLAGKYNFVCAFDSEISTLKRKRRTAMPASRVGGARVSANRRTPGLSSAISSPSKTCTPTARLRLSLIGTSSPTLVYGSRSTSDTVDLGTISLSDDDSETDFFSGTRSRYKKSKSIKDTVIDCTATQPDVVDLGTISLTDDDSDADQTRSRYKGKAMEGTVMDSAGTQVLSAPQDGTDGTPYSPLPPSSQPSSSLFGSGDSDPVGDEQDQGDAEDDGVGDGHFGGDSGSESGGAAVRMQSLGDATFTLKVVLWDESDCLLQMLVRTSPATGTALIGRLVHKPFSLWEEAILELWDDTISSWQGGYAKYTLVKLSPSVPIVLARVMGVRHCPDLSIQTICIKKLPVLSIDHDPHPSVALQALADLTLDTLEDAKILPGVEGYLEDSDEWHRVTFGDFDSIQAPPSTQPCLAVNGLHTPPSNQAALAAKPFLLPLGLVVEWMMKKQVAGADGRSRAASTSYTSAGARKKAGVRRAVIAHDDDVIEISDSHSSDEGRKLLAKGKGKAKAGVSTKWTVSMKASWTVNKDGKEHFELTLCTSSSDDDLAGDGTVH
ncbi:hypothetical protein OBBRIDRAFT_837589 [Obba rivulosa]|uniref:Uncharacterized protein n=1 Tax=Obba rivulosa TaxID=1052685 RepID=A0A8E2DHK8_9APHY|nr:hypothetical protein OBBRIDRAFT_837589 [Obba rivulosa]